MTLPTQRFEFISDTSSQYYEVSTSGTTVTMRYGDVGTDGKTTVKTFGTLEQAADFYERQVARVREFAQQRSAAARQRLVDQGATPGEAGYTAMLAVAKNLMDRAKDKP